MKKRIIIAAVMAPPLLAVWLLAGVLATSYGTGAGGDALAQPVPGKGGSAEVHGSGVAIGGQGGSIIWSDHLTGEALTGGNVTSTITTFKPVVCPPDHPIAVRAYGGDFMCASDLVKPKD